MTALDRALDSKFAEWFSLVWIIFAAFCGLVVVATVVVFLSVAAWNGIGEIFGLAVTS